MVALFLFTTLIASVIVAGTEWAKEDRVSRPTQWAIASLLLATLGACAIQVI